MESALSAYLAKTSSAAPHEAGKDFTPALIGTRPFKASFAPQIPWPRASAQSLHKTCLRSCPGGCTSSMPTFRLSKSTPTPWNGLDGQVRPTRIRSSSVMMLRPASSEVEHS